MGWSVGWRAASTGWRPPADLAPWHHDPVTLLQIVVVLAVVAAVGAVAAGVVTGGLPQATSTIPDPGLPDDALAVEDVAAVRFSIGFRGYRMDEVDDVLDRLADELAARDAALAERDAEISRLRGV